MPLASLPVLLRSLCLGEMARELDRLTEVAGREGWSHEQYLRALCDLETARRAVLHCGCRNCWLWQAVSYFMPTRQDRLEASLTSHPSETLGTTWA